MNYAGFLQLAAKSGNARARFTNRFCVSGIVLLSLDIGFHVGRRHQAHSVAERLKFARPIM
jgi:hypothetical protein